MASDRNGDAIVVRQAGLDDWPAISDFIGACYGSSARFKSQPRWRWQFLDTPYLSDGQPPVWIALNGERVVGQIALQPASLYLDGRAYPAGWIVDVMVRPECRGLGLAHRIHDAMAATGRTLVTLTMAPATRRVADRAGAITLPPVYELIRPGRLTSRTVSRSFGPRIERRSGLVRGFGRAFIASGIGPATAALAGRLAGAALDRGGRGAGDLQLTSTDAPDWPQVQPLFERMAVGAEALFDRGEAFMAWRFGRAPDLDYHFVESRRAGALTGLAVWRRPDPSELPVGSIPDVLTAPDDVASRDALIARCIEALSDSSEAILAGASDPFQLEGLKRHGFVVFKTHHPTVVVSDPALKAALARPRQWRFSKADHDWDQVLPADA